MDDLLQEIKHAESCECCKSNYARIKQLERRFPMLDGPDIDWVTAEKIYVIYNQLFTNRQSLERIAERGGFGWEGVEFMISKQKQLEDK